MGRIKLPQKKPHLVRKPKPNIRSRMAALKDNGIVKALRAHPLLGRGTQSILEQCFSDEEILEELDREKIFSASKAIQHFAIWEGIEIDDLIDADQDNSEDYIVDETEMSEEEVIWWREWNDYTKDPRE